MNNLSTGINIINPDKKADNPGTDVDRKTNLDIDINIVDINKKTDNSNINSKIANTDKKIYLGINIDRIDINVDKKVDNSNRKIADVNRKADNLNVGTKTNRKINVSSIGIRITNKNGQVIISNKGCVFFFYLYKAFFVVTFFKSKKVFIFLLSLFVFFYNIQ